jgi:hypothetical protein
MPCVEFVLRIPRRHGGPYKDVTRVIEMLCSFTKRFIWLMMTIIGYIFAAVVRVINLRPSKRLTRIRNPLLLQSATKIAHMIRTQQVSTKIYSNLDIALEFTLNSVYIIYKSEKIEKTEFVYEEESG